MSTIRRKTTHSLRKQYERGEKIVWTTCYDATFARLVEKAEIDVILVGDSLGNVVQGHATTLPVTVDDIVYHSRAVARGCARPHIVGDLPFMSYQANEDDGLRAAGRLLKEGRAQSVKIEGGEYFAPMVYRMTQAGIAVCGHLGFTPQSVHKFGGYRVQGRTEEAAEQMIKDAKALTDAGIHMLVLEMVPAAVAKKVTEAIDIPTIGIGAGTDVDGQVLVLQDILGLNQDFKAKFAKQYANLEDTVVEALSMYKKEVSDVSFPSDEYSF